VVTLTVLLSLGIFNYGRIMQKSAFFNTGIRTFAVALVAFAATFCAQQAYAQDMLPADNGLTDYHTQPRWRESESHPLRIAAYIVHPIGWVLRELIFRPISAFAGSTEVTKSVMGFREPFDYRQPECFSSDDSAPDCRSISPFDYDRNGTTTTTTTESNTGIATGSLSTGGTAQVYFPNINFDFNKHTLSAVGKEKAKQLAGNLKSDVAVHVVLQGNTDSVGSDKYNERLGMNRAMAVKNELIALGISGDRLATVTFGESHPIDTNDTAEGRAVNRRVDVVVDQK
jgi:outer membrane protein OmpA-like peptidoglycan-associated protein